MASFLREACQAGTPAGRRCRNDGELIHRPLTCLRPMRLSWLRCSVAGRAVQMAFDTSVTPDGSINFATTNLPSDVCINGMALGYGAYFGSTDPRLHRIVDYLLRVQMEDGGWNCEYARAATHASVHTTISVLEGLLEYRAAGYVGATDGNPKDSRREDVIQRAEARAMEFILRHQLFMSDHTGEVIKPQFLMLSYPSRWHYDILRALDYFQSAGVAYDERMAPALSVLVKKRRADGTWPLQAKHPGQVHFDMEETGCPSRWNTLRALRVMRKYG
ncbi:MAG: hypothetical protein WD024_03915 [Bacillota bacterium]